MNNLGEPAMVTWEDAWDDRGYYSLDIIHEAEPKMLISTGFLIRNNVNGVSLARDSSAEGFRSALHIPRAMVRQVIHVAPVKPKTVVKRKPKKIVLGRKK